MGRYWQNSLHQCLCARTQRVVTASFWHGVHPCLTWCLFTTDQTRVYQRLASARPRLACACSHQNLCMLTCCRKVMQASRLYFSGSEVKLCNSCRTHSSPILIAGFADAAFAQYRSALFPYFHNQEQMGVQAVSTAESSCGFQLSKFPLAPLPRTYSKCGLYPPLHCLLFSLLVRSQPNQTSWVFRNTTRPV